MSLYKALMFYDLENLLSEIIRRDYRVSSFYLNIAIEIDFKEGLSCLLEHNVDPNNLCWDLNEYPIHTAVRLGNVEIIKDLIDHGADTTVLSHQNAIDFTPFCYAIVHNQMDVVDYFLRANWEHINEATLVCSVLASCSLEMLDCFLNLVPETFESHIWDYCFVPLLAAANCMIGQNMIMWKGDVNEEKYINFLFKVLERFPIPEDKRKKASIDLVGLAFGYGMFEVAEKIILLGFNSLELEDLIVFSNLIPGFSRILKQVKNPQKDDYADLPNSLINYVNTPIYTCTHSFRDLSCSCPAAF